MKTIRLRKGEKFPSIDVLKSVAELPSAESRGFGLEEIRRRMRLLDVIEKVPADAESLALEDADYEFLRMLYGRFPFALAHRDIVTIADDLEKPLDAS